MKYFTRICLAIFGLFLLNSAQGQIPLFQGSPNRTIMDQRQPNGSFQLSGVIGHSEQNKPVMVADLSKEQVKKECNFFRGDSLNGFDFDAAYKQAEVEGDKMYQEFRVFMFRTQVTFVKKKYNIQALPYEIAMQEASKKNTPPSVLASACSNMDFENGDFSSWVGASGVNQNSNSFLFSMGTAYYGTNQNIYDCGDLQLISSAYGNDPAGGFPGKAPMGGNYSARLGGMYINLASCHVPNCPNGGWDGGTCDASHWNLYSGTPVPANGEYISQTFSVTASNALVAFDYAVVLNDGGHPNGQQPYFHVYATNSSGTVLNPTCTEYYVQAVNGSAPAGFTLSSLSNTYNTGSPYYYQGWKSNSMNLTPYIGQTITLYFVAAGCSQGGHSAWAYIDATCGPAQVITSNSTPCTGTNVTLTAPAVTGGSYSWTGPGIVGSTIGQSIKVNASGTYVVTVVPSQGAGCSYTLSIPVNFTANPTISVTAASSSICKGASTILNANATGATSYSWAPGGQTGPSISVSPNTTQVYTVTVSNANSCSSLSTVTVTVTAPPTITASSTQTGCSTATGTATANPSGGTPSYTYLWNNGQANQTATGLAIGIYTVTVTDSKGCSNVTTANVTGALAPTVTASGTPASCSAPNGTATANASGGTPGYSYAWSNGQNGQNATGLAPGSYNVTVTDAGGCSAMTTVNITGTSAPSVTTSSSPAGCSVANGTATANASGGTPNYNYLWSNGQNTQIATGLSSGTYTVIITDASGCTAFSTVTISNPQPMSLSVSGNDTICAGEHTTLTATVNGGTPTYTYAWVPGPYSSPTVVVNPNSSTAYSVVITDANGCSTSAQSFNVSVLPSANAAFDTASSGTLSALYSFTNQSSGGTSWLWNFGDASPTTTQQNPVHEFPGAGTYTVTQIVYNQSGCPDTIKKIIRIKEGMLIPNVFSPDGDGVNDVWFIPNSGVKDFHVQIFDRWGAKVFESTADEIRWDGRSSSGKPLTEGTYYYSLQAVLKTETGQKDYNTTGYVTLITNKK